MERERYKVLLAWTGEVRSKIDEKLINSDNEEVKNIAYILREVLDIIEDL